MCTGVLYYVSSTVNPILYNVMSCRYRRAFCDTLLRCRPRRRLSTSSRRSSLNAAALTASFVAVPLRNERLRARLSISRSAMTVTSLTTTKTLSVDNDELAIHRGDVDTDQLAVAGRHRTLTDAPDIDDAWTVVRSEEVVETTSGATVDAVQVRAIPEHRRHNLPVLRSATASAATDCF